MEGAKIGFIIWALIGGFMVALGIRAMFMKKAAGFWANARPPKIKDGALKAYNCATGSLFIAYGVIFVLLGLPMVIGESVLLMMLSIVGVMIETIAVMVIYSLVISKKYTDQGNNGQ